MAKVSVIIPSRNERFLAQTVNDVLTKATGDIEVICVLDGYWCEPPLRADKRLHIIHRGRAMGLRAAVNAGAQLAKGKYILKCDAHCMFGQGYDEILQADCDDNWLVVPSRYSLDAENWAIAQTGKARVDYHYLSWPFPPGLPPGCGLHGVPWNARARERYNKPEYDIDDEMSFQGSCYFMPTEHYKRIGGMDESLYGQFMGEPQELGLKTWLSGGRCVTNKKTWYAHLHKGSRYGRGYNLPGGERERYSLVGSDYWMHDKWEGRIHDIDWLIDKFWPVPTWPENWKELPRDASAYVSHD